MTKVNDTVIRKIDDDKVEITLLNTSRAFITGQQLLTLGLPSAGAAVDGMGFAAFEDSSTWSMSASLLVQQMATVDILGIIKELLEFVKVNGEDVDFETYFRGDLGKLIKFVEFALVENYSSLFTGTSLSLRLAQYMKAYQTLSNSQAQTPEQETEQAE